MDNHVKGFFCQFSDDTPKGNFHKVIALHEMPEMNWNNVIQLVPNFCKGWWELAHLSAKDRIEFIRDFWLSTLPYHPKLNGFLHRFFGSLEDIEIFITQKVFDEPYQANLVYCLKNDSGFFRGQLPASDDEIILIETQFSNVIFPADYLAFLRIHNGFCKTTDVTGIASTGHLKELYNEFQTILSQIATLTTNKGTTVNPKSLIPFYKSFGMPFFQCFWSEWYPENEMGNVYFSGISKTISEVNISDPSAEGMAFPTFLDWLMFYMEQIIE